VATTYLPVLLSAVKDAPGLIGLAMVVNAVAGFAVPLVVGLWSDKRHTVRHGRRPFLLGGAILTVCGLAAIAFGYQTSFLMLTLAGLVTYVGVNIVTTAHRTLVHDHFEDGGHARGNGAQEVAALTGALVGLIGGGMLSEVAAWAPFALAAIAMPVLVWPTFRRIPVATHVNDAPERDGHHPMRYYLRAIMRPGVRPMIAAEVLWVLGYAALPVFFILYAENVLGLSTALASLWLATFAIAAGIAMLFGGRVRTPQYKLFLFLGVGLMGVGFLTIASSTNLVIVSLGVLAAAVGFGLISTLGYALFAAIIPLGEAGGYTALYFALRAAAAAVALPVAGVTIAATGSYRSMFVLGGIATLAALLPLFYAPSPKRAAILRARVI
jgi:MFS family permease